MKPFLALSCGIVLSALTVSCSSTVRTGIMRTDAVVRVSDESVQSRLYREIVNDESLVDYDALVRNPELLEKAYTQITERSPDSHPSDFSSSDEAFAYWLNAYNIATIYGVVKAYPINSVQDFKPFSLYSLIPGGGFFAAQKFVFGGQSHSLYALENNVIRKRFDDPRLHFALNCASIGCPDLSQEPYSARHLNKQLDRQARAFINSPKGLQIDHEAKEIRISSIFDWYAEDFQTDEQSVLDYVANYYSSKDELISARENGYGLSYLEYDWSLNRQ